MIEFPTSPIFGQQYEYQERAWVFNGVGWIRLYENNAIQYVEATPYIEFETTTYFPASDPFVTEFEYIGAPT